MSRLETDVLVVGAGPGGSATAYHLARHGIDVTVVERSAFPREKVCGDGLTPRGVAALLKMGVDPAEPGFERVKGLRVHSREATIELPFPQLRTFPDYGLVRTRHDFDALLMQRAQKAGARLMERTEALEPDHQRRMGPRSHDPSRRGQGRGADRDARPVRDRVRRRGVAVRQAGRRHSRREPPARDRGAPLLPHRLPPRSVARVVARPVGGRPPAPGLRLAVPGRRAARSTWAPAC